MMSQRIQRLTFSSDLSDWLYQYWFFCFKTAKHWGKGPTAWTSELLDFGRFPSKLQPSLPSTPHDQRSPFEPHARDEPRPSDSCRWFIHVRESQYAEIPEEVEAPEDLASHDLNDDSTWPLWPQNQHEPPLQTRLRDRLEHNDFSTISVASLPLAIPHIAQTAQRSPDELLLESLGFSIMSRNLDQVARIARELQSMNMSFASLRPFHLATSFLDGFKSCCNILPSLAMFVSGPQLREIYTNERGHTVLDNLMISIIKSHTLAKPVVMDSSLTNVTRFIGEEVDICGRWDADASCVRHHHANGSPSIPIAWKHKFCNTSTQTICHCISRIFQCMPTSLLKDAPSGLYVRQCFSVNCGKNLQLQPFHSMVMTAYHLACSGCEDEDLFGMLACVLCIVSCGYDPHGKADLSVNALLDADVLVDCDHEELTAAELAERISEYPIIEQWSEKLRLGWAVLRGVLRLCEDGHIEDDIDETSDSDRDGDQMDIDSETEDGIFRCGFMGSTEPEKDWEQGHIHEVVAPCFRKRRDLATLWE